MKMKYNSGILLLSLLVCTVVCYGCSSWTDDEAKLYADMIEDSDFPDPGSGEDDPGGEDVGNGGLPEEADDAFYQRLREYRQSDHKKFGGWLGGWTGYSGKRLSQGSLASLPYGIDYACIWLFTSGEGYPIENFHRDAAEFHRRGGVTLMCWSARNIGDGLTPKGQTASAVFGTGDEGIKKYAQAIVDTCVKYHIDGFENDMEGSGPLIQNKKETNLFLNELISRFKKAHEDNPETCAGIVSVDIPIWGSYVGQHYPILDNDVLEKLYMIQWQSYTELQSDMSSYFGTIKNYNTEMYDEVMEKSIITATFEEGDTKKAYLKTGINRNHNYDGHTPYGYGAYHIEYDFDNEYKYVRECIKLANPGMPSEFDIMFNYNE